MIVRLKQLKEMNIKVALMCVIVCNVICMSVIDVTVTFFLHVSYVLHVHASCNWEK